MCSHCLNFNTRFHLDCLKKIIHILFLRFTIIILEHSKKLTVENLSKYFIYYQILR